MLERERLAEERAAIAIQSAYRGRRDQKAYQDTVQHVTKIQSHMRGYLERALLEQQMELEWAMLTTAAATTIQAAWRGHAAKTAYSEKSGAVLGIQTAYRRSSASRQYEAQKKAGLFVQRLVRGWLVRKRNQADADEVDRAMLEDASAVLLQCSWRGYQARKALEGQLMAEVV